MHAYTHRQQVSTTLFTLKNTQKKLAQAGFKPRVFLISSLTLYQLSHPATSRQDVQVYLGLQLVIQLVEVTEPGNVLLQLCFLLTLALHQLPQGTQLPLDTQARHQRVMGETTIERPGWVATTLF